MSKNTIGIKLTKLEIKAKRREINGIKGGVRKVARYRVVAKDVRKRCLVKIKVGVFKNGKDKIINHYKCEHCGEIHREEPEVDHIIEIGDFPWLDKDLLIPDWNLWISRVMCAIENLQGLCNKCHTIKTKLYNKGEGGGGEFYI